MAPHFVTDFEPRYGELVEVAPGIRRIVARNPSKYTGWGTGTYVLGRGRVTVVDPGALSETRVRAAPTPSWGGDGSGPVERTLRQLRRDAAATDVEIVVRVEEGKVNETLARVADEEGAGLIVTGTVSSVGR